MNVTKGIEEETKGEEEEGLLFMASTNEGVNTSEAWLIDSDCGNHMIGNKNLFQTLESTTIQQMVRLGDGKVLKVASIGNVLFRSTTRKTSILTKIQYVPKLAHNLLSVGQLMTSGYSVAFEDG